MIDIPPAVRSKARAAGCATWLDAIPAILGELAAAWNLTPGAPYADGTEAYVCRADLADGTAAVLKLMVPRDPRLTDREATVLRLAGGDGCARLLAYAPEHQAMLLERLGPSLSVLGVPVDRRHEILCDLAARLWRPAPDADLPTGAWKAAWLAEQIASSWEGLGRPCSERVIDQALSCAERRCDAHDDERAVLVHGDIHQWNTLRTSDGGFKLVDPDGLLAEPEYDLGIVMREDPLDLLAEPADERARRLARLTGRDATAIREWGVVERVSTALLCLEIDMVREGEEMLRAAEHVAAA